MLHVLQFSYPFRRSRNRYDSMVSGAGDGGSRGTGHVGLWSCERPIPVHRVVETMKIGPLIPTACSATTDRTGTTTGL